MLEANFISGYETVTVQGLTQWDKGQKLQITGLATLPATFQVHFANTTTVEAIVMLGSTVAGVGTVDIPNSLLEAELDFKAWIYVIDAEGSETIKTILFPLTKRTKPADFISEPNPTEQTILEEIMTTLNATNVQVALKADQSDLDITNSQLAEITKADETVVFLPIKKGITLWAGDEGTYTIAAIRENVDSVVSAGFKDVFVYVQENMTSTTANTLTQLFDDTYISEMITYAKSKGLSVTGIKVHINPNGATYNLNPSDKATWFANYKTALLHYANIAVANNVEYIGISNEIPTLTSDYLSYWTDIITTIKALGLKVFSCFTSYECYACCFKNLLDVIGLNLYPIVSYNRENATQKEIKIHWYRDLIGTNYVKIIHDMKAYGKPVWVTETGCTDFIDALSAPSSWIFTDQTKSTVIQSMYHQAALRILGQELYDDGSPLVNGYYVWNSKGAFNPIQYASGIALFQKYFGGQ